MTQELSAEVDRLLAKLPTRQADAVRLRFFGGLKFREISACQGCCLTTAKNRVKWGLLAMAEQLNADHIEPYER